MPKPGGPTTPVSGPIFANTLMTFQNSFCAWPRPPRDFFAPSWRARFFRTLTARNFFFKFQLARGGARRAGRGHRAAHCPGPSPGQLKFEKKDENAEIIFGRNYS